MKRIVLLFVLLSFFTGGTMAQNNFINYQQIVRNANGQLVVRQNVEAVVTMFNEENGTAVFSEKHLAATNSDGIISFRIGEGEFVSGDFSQILWQSAYIQTDITIPGGPAITSKHPLTAVPYAHFADQLDEAHLIGFLKVHQYLDSTDLKGIETERRNTLDSLLDNTKNLEKILSRIIILIESDLADLGETEATCNGEIIAYGVQPLEYGLCWSTSSNPTIGDLHLVLGSGQGPFSGTLTGLTANTTYYVRGYATTADSTIYSEGIVFKTQPACGDLIITDIDGNAYPTVQIGKQCWMKENLRATRYANGDSIKLGGTTASTATAYFYYPNENEGLVGTYGLFYNAPAVLHGQAPSSSCPSGVQGPCPNGWHVPSYPEWEILATNVASDPQNICSGDIAASLCEQAKWNSNTSTSCSVGNTSTTHNQTGFSLRPAGGCLPNPESYSHGYDSPGKWAEMLSTTANDYSLYHFVLEAGKTNVKKEGTSNYACASSLRCVRD